jgi:hypothetical protein
VDAAPRSSAPMLAQAPALRLTKRYLSVTAARRGFIGHNVLYVIYLALSGASQIAFSAAIGQGVTAIFRHVITNQSGASIALVFIGVFFIARGFRDAWRGLRDGVFRGKGPTGYFECSRADEPVFFWLNFLAWTLMAVIGAAVAWKGMFPNSS